LVRTAYALGIVALVAACGGQTGGVGDAAVDVSAEATAALYGPCDGGCPDGSLCAFALDGGCGAVGQCVPLLPGPPTCKAYDLCGCDGVTFLGRCDVPVGYCQAPSAGGYIACMLDAASDGSNGWDGATSCAAILASNYDQSCTSDSDCVLVNVGYPCGNCAFQCGSDVGAINVGARAQYMGDVSRTPRMAAVCNCPPIPPIPNVSCCHGGQCKAENDCVSAGDAALE
jgi:hypothetical protein